MKKIILRCLLFLLPVPLIIVAALQTTFADNIDWQQISNWKLEVKPLAMVHTLDNQKVYILGDDHKVHVYTTQGVKLGSIPVDAGVTAIDIAPRGEMLYLVNGENNSFTSLAINFVTPIDVTGAPFLGNENAPVVLAVFSDFQ